MANNTKKCIKCGSFKKLSEFRKYKIKGYSQECKKCLSNKAQETRRVLKAIKKEAYNRDLCGKLVVQSILLNKESKFDNLHIINKKRYYLEKNRSRLKEKLWSIEKELQSIDKDLSSLEQRMNNIIKYALDDYRISLNALINDDLPINDLTLAISKDIVELNKIKKQIKIKTRNI